MRVRTVRARVIKNSRGEDAIEVTVNKRYTASTPSGASRGKYEVSPFSHRGVQFSVTFVNKYPHFSRLSLDEFGDLAVFDSLLPVIGGNAVLALQLACLKAMAQGDVYRFLNPRAKKLPIPLGNCVGGGAHTHGQHVPDVQEYLLVPQGKTFAERMMVNQGIYDLVGRLAGARARNDEGAYVLQVSDENVFRFLTMVLDGAERMGLRAALGIDLAASQLFVRGAYHYHHLSSHAKVLSRREQIALVRQWIKDYHLVYVEDPLDEEDFDGFSQINTQALVCGDDLVATNLERLKLAHKKRSVNCVIVKPNQAGSLVKTWRVVQYCQKNDIMMVISHRSGETMDTSIAHLAVAWKVPYIKCGIHGKEREVKLQELVRIEQEIL